MRQVLCSNAMTLCRKHCADLLEELKKVSGGKGGAEEDAQSSLNRKYRNFYIERLKAVNSRRLRSRFAAASLIASLKHEQAGGSSAVLLNLAGQVVNAVDAHRDSTNLEMLQSEVIYCEHQAIDASLWCVYVISEIDWCFTFCCSYRKSQLTRRRARSSCGQGRKAQQQMACHQWPCACPTPVYCKILRPILACTAALPQGNVSKKLRTKSAHLFRRLTTIPPPQPPQRYPCR